jgi:hypothetical protein
MPDRPQEEIAVVRRPSMCEKIRGYLRRAVIADLARKYHIKFIA